MTKLFSLGTLLILVSLFLYSCGSDDDSTETVDYDYHAHINAPTNEAKNVSDTMHIHINFESHTGEPVHHINVRVYNETDTTNVVYNKPTEAHVHEMSGEYDYHDNFILSNANGITGHSDWILEAKVWGEDGAGVVVDTIGFHVHPE